MRRHNNPQNDAMSWGTSPNGSRAGGGGYYRGGGDSSILESENNRHISQLGDQVSLLKGLTLEIGNEVESQNTLLDQLGNSMFDTSGMLGSTLKRINDMMARGGSRHMCYLIAFIVFTFLAIWFILSRK
jgi:blocked-early-in-transport protein 1